MNGTIRQSMAWLHTWSGLLVGWIVFAMFCTGTVTFFRSEIGRWMEPETGRPTSSAMAVVTAQAYLQKAAPGALTWNIVLPDEREGVTRVSWRPHPAPGEDLHEKMGMGMAAAHPSAKLDPSTGVVVTPRATRGSDFFYRVHFQMQYVSRMTGRYIAGIAGMFMLAAMVSGVITHKRIFSDFFTFRPNKAAQRSWLDAHNMTAVLALPFHFMITYTGLMLLMGYYMPWGANANYKDPQAYIEAHTLTDQPFHPIGQAAPLAALGPILAQARQTWGEGSRPGLVTVHNPGDISAKVVVDRHSGDQLSDLGERLTFSGVDGTLLSRVTAGGPASTITHVLYGLHFGRFAGPGLRWLYFLCSLSGCFMVATGLVLWTVKRRKDLPDPDKPHFGFRLVERLNIGTIAGVPAGMAAMLWANRLLPVDMATRSPWEVHSFFIVWILMILYACVRPARQAWAETLGAAAFMVAGLPVVSAITTPNRSLLNNLLAADWAMVAFDLTLFVLGGMLAFIAHKAWTWRPVAKKPRRNAVADSKEALV